jgi:putative cell wall-binding protein
MMTRKKYWSAEVTRRSASLQLEEGVFTWNDPKRIAQSLKRSAMASTARKGTPYQSAMSMLNFYINRAGTKLPKSSLHILTQAKAELRRVFNRL